MEETVELEATLRIRYSVNIDKDADPAESERELLDSLGEAQLDYLYNQTEGFSIVGVRAIDADSE